MKYLYILLISIEPNWYIHDTDSFLLIGRISISGIFNDLPIAENIDREKNMNIIIQLEL